MSRLTRKGYLALGAATWSASTHSAGLASRSSRAAFADHHRRIKSAGRPRHAIAHAAAAVHPHATGAAHDRVQLAAHHRHHGDRRAAGAATRSAVSRFTAATGPAAANTRH